MKLSEILRMKKDCAETKATNIEQDKYQHIKLKGFDGTYSAISIEEMADTVFVLLKPDSGYGVNLLCEKIDESLIYLMNTHCTSVDKAFK